MILPPTGPWQRIPAIVPRNEFGKGCVHDFSWFFQGKTKVRVNSVEDVCRWLCKCKYVEDRELFMEDDFWQHPVTFEVTRQGDCDDHAIWAWRKLTELGYLAEFVAGRLSSQEEAHKRNIRSPLTGHVWVIFKKKESKDWRLLETTEKNPKLMLQRAEDTKDIYLPEVSVDNNFNTYRFRKF